jgi:acetolactate synthase small subunit
MHLLLLTTNRFGVLARITSVVSSVGINIETAAAYPVAGSDLSIVHLSLQADGIAIQRAARRLSRLVDVLEVRADEDNSPLSFDFGRYIAPFTQVREACA